MTEKRTPVIASLVPSANEGHGEAISFNSQPRNLTELH